MEGWSNWSAPEDDHDIAARIERLFVIPRKSCAGFELEASVLGATGLEYPAVGVERFRRNALLSGLEAHDEERLDVIRIVTLEGVARELRVGQTVTAVLWFE